MSPSYLWLCVQKLNKYKLHTFHSYLKVALNLLFLTSSFWTVFQRQKPHDTDALLANKEISCDGSPSPYAFFWFQINAAPLMPNPKQPRKMIKEQWGKQVIGDSFLNSGPGAFGEAGRKTRWCRGLLEQSSQRALVLCHPHTPRTPTTCSGHTWRVPWLPGRGGRARTT